jgi:hypothetical protein
VFNIYTILILMKAYDTLVEALNDLKKRGYTLDFNVLPDGLHCAERDIRLYPEDFEIVEVYRFEGETNPTDESILYAIESNIGEKGVLVNAYGRDADPVGDAMAKKLTIHLH